MTKTEIENFNEYQEFSRIGGENYVQMEENES